MRSRAYIKTNQPERTRMSCNFCKYINKRGMSQYCPKQNGKEIIYDQSTDCDYYKPIDDAPSWVSKPKPNQPERTMNKCNDPDHGAINAERAESRGLRKAWVELDDKRQSLERELTAVTEQRDRLAEALRSIVNLYENPDKGCIPDSYEMYDSALQSLTNPNEL